MKTMVNGIEIDYATKVPTSRSFDVTYEPVQSSEHQDITTHIKSNLPEFTLRFTLKGDDQQERFDRLLRLADNKEVVTLKQDISYDRLVITDIKEVDDFMNVIDFDITFKQINTVDLETTSEPLPAKLRSLQQESKQGLQQTSEANIENPDYP